MVKLGKIKDFKNSKFKKKEKISKFYELKNFDF